MTRKTAYSSAAFNFRVDKESGEMAVRCHHHHHHQIAQFYVQRSSGFADPPLLFGVF
jgi:hypothetical protein